MDKDSRYCMSGDFLADAEAVERRAGRTIEAARSWFPPEASDAGETELADIITKRLSPLPKERQTELRREALAGLQEMEGVVCLLEAYMQRLSLQLNKVATHTSAAAAYTRSGRR